MEEITEAGDRWCHIFPRHALLGNGNGAVPIYLDMYLCKMHEGVLLYEGGQQLHHKGLLLLCLPSCRSIDNKDKYGSGTKTGQLNMHDDSHVCWWQFHKAKPIENFEVHPIR
jgi:hypothetical protein